MTLSAPHTDDFRGSQVVWLGSMGVLATLCETGALRRYGLDESTGGDSGRLAF